VPRSSRERSAPATRRIASLTALALLAAAAVGVEGTSVDRAEAQVVVVVPGCIVHPDDVIGWWKGDGDLTAEIGPDLTGSASGFAPALIDQGIVFGGSDVVGVDGFPAVSTGLTVEMWIKPVRESRTQALATRWDFPSTDDSARAFSLLLSSAGELIFETDETSTRRPELLSAVAPQLFDGNFHHVAATWDQTTMALYVDGVQVGVKASQRGVLNPAVSTPFRLGSKLGIGDPFSYTGTIDEAAIMRRALTPAEVDDMVGAGPKGKCKLVDTSGLAGPGLQLPADAGAVDPVITPNGRYVLFRTRSTDTFPVVTDPGAQAPGIDLDLFGTDRDDLVLYDSKDTVTTTDDTIELVSVGSDGRGGGLDSSGGSITPTASHIAFASISNDLVPGDTLAGRDVFVRDRTTGTTQRISVRSDGSQPELTPTGQNNDSRAPAISDNGKVIAFESTNRNLAPETNPVPGDTWQTYDIYVRDISDPNPANHVTERVTTGLGGAKANGSSSTPIISADGNLVWFSSAASNLVAGDTNGQVDMFIHNRQLDTTIRLDWTTVTGAPAVDGGSWIADVSPNRRWIAFSSNATNIVPGDTNGRYDAFLLDTQTSAVVKVSPMAGAPQADGDSFARAVTDNGRIVTFESTATNLVPGDTNGRSDIFATDKVKSLTRRISLGPDDEQRPGASSGASVSTAPSTLVYMYQAPGEGTFTLWRAQLALVVPA
jgi:hypothetical protein